MDGGTVLHNDKLANILKTFGGATYQLTLVGTPSTKDVQILESMTGISQAECLGRNDLLLRMTDTFSLNRSLVFLNKHGLALTDIVKQERSLEDVCLTLTGKRLRD